MVINDFEDACGYVGCIGDVLSGVGDSFNGKTSQAIRICMGALLEYLSWDISTLIEIPKPKPDEKANPAAITDEEKQKWRREAARIAQWQEICRQERNRARALSKGGDAV